MQIRVGGSSLWVEDCGVGSPLVLVHSLSFDHDMWEAQADALQDSRRVIRIDMRGHGRSTAGDTADGLTLDDLADDVAGVLDVLQVDAVSFAGLSLGGMVAMRFALRYPKRIRALALMNTSAEPEPSSIRQAYHDGNENMRASPGNPAMAAMMLGLMFSDDFRQHRGDVVDRYRRKLIDRRDPEGHYHVAKAVIWRESVLDALSAIDVPTIVVTSDRDRAIPAARGEAMHRAITKSRLVQIEGAGHMTSVEKPNRITGVLRELA